MFCGGSSGRLLDTLYHIPAYNTPFSCPKLYFTHTISAKTKTLKIWLVSPFSRAASYKISSTFIFQTRTRMVLHNSISIICWNTAYHRFGLNQNFVIRPVWIPQGHGCANTPPHIWIETRLCTLAVLPMIWTRKTVRQQFDCQCTKAEYTFGNITVHISILVAKNKQIFACRVFYILPFGPLKF